MTRWFPRLLALLIGIQFVFYAVRPTISYQAIALGAGPVEIGIVTAAYSVLSLLLAVPIGRLVDRWGERPVLVVGCALVAGLPLLVLVADSIPALAGCNALVGASQTISIIAIQSLIAKGSSPDIRESRFSLFSASNALGMLLGPAALALVVGNVTAVATLGTVPNSGAMLALGTAVGAVALIAAVSLLLLPGALAARPTIDAAQRNASGAVRRVLGMPSMPHAMASSLTVLATADLLMAYLPLYGEARGLSVRVVGLLLAAMSVAMLISRLTMPMMVRTFGRRRVLLCCLLVPAGGVAVLPLVAQAPGLFAVVIAIGFTLGLGQPITLNWVASRAPREIRGTAMSLRLTGNRLAQVVVPAVVGVIAGATGLAAAFWSPAVMLVTSSGLVLRSDIDSLEPDPPPPDPVP